jgi:outer membrane receptor protein involved in Fe transport
MDQANTETYAGHQLLNIRVDYPVTKQFNINARLLNIADTTYATNSSYSAPSNFSGEKFEYAPGMPRTAYIAANYRF